MAPLVREQKEVALGLTYAIKHLEQSVALIVGTSEGWSQGSGEGYDRFRERLSAIKEVLGNASNLRKVESTSHFGVLGITFITGVDKTHRKLLSAVQNRYSWNEYYEVVNTTLDQFDKTIAKYQLNYPICEESTNAASHPLNALGSPTSVSGPSATPPTWIWDFRRNEYYRWSPNDNCYIYSSGLILNANFQPVTRSHVRHSQFVITNEEVD